jgi:TolB protein
VLKSINRFFVISFVVFILIALINPVSAALRIEITEGIEGAERIAVVPFGWRGKGKSPGDIAGVIDGNLHRSGRFSPLDRKDMLAKPTQSAQIKFKNWRLLEIPYLVIGNMREVGGNYYHVEFRLFDVYRSREMRGVAYKKVHRSQLRMIAHQISDTIYQELTGERGAFATKLAYVKKMPKATNPKFRYWLIIADSDTQNEQLVLKSRRAILSPTWSPKSDKLAFVVLHKKGPSVYIYDLVANKNDRVTFSHEKFSAPSWSPDGKKLALQKLGNGSADVFVLDLKSKRKRRITRHWAIDAEPVWAPDGKSLIFTSDRGGQAQLYQHSFTTGGTTRLTFEGKYNTRASFSPDGSMITFVHLSGDGQFHVAVMDLATNQMRLLTKASYEESEHESPSFAPNGSMIIYAANYRNKRGLLASVSTDGQVHLRYAHERGMGEVREPAWSSFLN